MTIDLYEGVLLAHVMTRIQAAKDYGFITGGPDIDMAQVDRWLAVGEEHNIRPTEQEIEAASVAFVRELA